MSFMGNLKNTVKEKKASDFANKRYCNKELLSLTQKSTLERLRSKDEKHIISIKNKKRGLFYV